MKLHEIKDGVLIELFVKPNSKKFQLVIEGEEIIVYCTEEPIKGKVNKELVKALSRILRTNVEIVSGATSRQKMVLVKSLKKDEIEKILSLAS